MADPDCRVCQKYTTHFLRAVHPHTFNTQTQESDRARHGRDVDTMRSPSLSFRSGEGRSEKQMVLRNGNCRDHFISLPTGSYVRLLPAATARHLFFPRGFRVCIQVGPPCPARPACSEQRGASGASGPPHPASTRMTTFPIRDIPIDSRTEPLGLCDEAEICNSESMGMEYGARYLCVACAVRRWHAAIPV